MQITGQEKPNNNVFILAGQQWAVGTGGRPGWAGQESRPREPASHLDLTTHCDIAASDVLCVSNVPYSTAAATFTPRRRPAAAVMKKPRARSSTKRD